MDHPRVLARARDTIWLGVRCCTPLGLFSSANAIGLRIYSPMASIGNLEADCAMSLLERKDLDLTGLNPKYGRLHVYQDIPASWYAHYLRGLLQSFPRSKSTNSLDQVFAFIGLAKVLGNMSSKEHIGTVPNTTDGHGIAVQDSGPSVEVDYAISSVALVDELLHATNYSRAMIPKEDYVFNLLTRLRVTPEQLAEAIMKGPGTSSNVSHILPIVLPWTHVSCPTPRNYVEHIHECGRHWRQGCEDLVSYRVNVRKTIQSLQLPSWACIREYRPCVNLQRMSVAYHPNAELYLDTFPRIAACPTCGLEGL